MAPNGGGLAALPKGARLCLLCTRFEVDRIVISMRINNASFIPARVLLTPYYNLVGVDGEYDLHDCNGPRPFIDDSPVSPYVRGRIDKDAWRRKQGPGCTMWEQLLRKPNSRGGESEEPVYPESASF